MQISKNLTRQLQRFGLLFFLAFALAGCTVNLVADYDSVAFEEILKVGKKIDRFYGDLLETKSNERAYQKFGDRYVDLETDIRSLVTRNKARALNEDSTQISEITLKLWMKYKENHKAKDTYSDGNAKLDRNRFIRLFAAAAGAERAKKLDADDKDTDMDSK
jgi:hypothetical protein